MATAQRTSGQTVTKGVDPSVLLEEILNKSVSAKTRTIETALVNRIEKIRELLPDGIKDQAERLVKRAMLTFAKNGKLQNCSPASFISCVLSAAECGLAIDGKLAHAVPYGNEAQFQPDYKGLISVAKRTGQIVDIYGDVVCENDLFEHGRSGDVCRCDHSYSLKGDRGEVIGAYQIIVLPGGRWRYELMSRSDLDKIQRRSKSGNSGPWSTDANEMRKKTVAKRALKTYCDDPGLLKAIEYDDMDYEDEKPQQSRVGRSNLNDALKVPVAENPSQFEEPKPSPQVVDDPFSGPARDDADCCDTPDAAQPIVATGSIVDILAACKTRLDIDKAFADFSAEVDAVPMEVEARYQELREALPAATSAGGKQKSMLS